MYDRYIYNCEFVNNYDGDTVTLNIDLGFNHWMKNQKIRLFGIDTAEIRGVEREAGLVAKDFVFNALRLADQICLKSIKDKSGKYGRWLGVIYYCNVDMWINLNEHLLSEGLAKEYK